MKNEISKENPTREWNIDDRVRVPKEQILSLCDCYGTIVRVFDTMLKIKLDGGRNLFISKHHCTPLN